MTNPSDCGRWWGHVHWYGKWQLVHNLEIVHRDGTKGKAGDQITQKRVCERCGFEDWHTTALLVGHTT